MILTTGEAPAVACSAAIGVLALGCKREQPAVPPDDAAVGEAGSIRRAGSPVRPQSASAATSTPAATSA